MLPRANTMSSPPPSTSLASAQHRNKAPTLTGRGNSVVLPTVSSPSRQTRASMRTAEAANSTPVESVPEPAPTRTLGWNRAVYQRARAYRAAAAMKETKHEDGADASDGGVSSSKIVRPVFWKFREVADSVRAGTSQMLQLGNALSTWCREVDENISEKKQRIHDAEVEAAEDAERAIAIPSMDMRLRLEEIAKEAEDKAAATGGNSGSEGDTTDEEEEKEAGGNASLSDLVTMVNDLLSTIAKTQHLIEITKSHTSTNTAASELGCDILAADNDAKTVQSCDNLAADNDAKTVQSCDNLAADNDAKTVQTNFAEMHTRRLQNRAQKLASLLEKFDQQTMKARKAILARRSQLSPMPRRSCRQQRGKAPTNGPQRKSLFHGSVCNAAPHTSGDGYTHTRGSRVKPRGNQSKIIAEALGIDGLNDTALDIAEPNGVFPPTDVATASGSDAVRVHGLDASNGEKVLPSRKLISPTDGDAVAFEAAETTTSTEGDAGSKHHSSTSAVESAVAPSVALPVERGSITAFPRLQNPTQLAVDTMVNGGQKASALRRQHSSTVGLRKVTLLAPDPEFTNDGDVEQQPPLEQPQQTQQQQQQQQQHERKDDQLEAGNEQEGERDGESHEVGTDDMDKNEKKIEDVYKKRSRRQGKWNDEEMLSHLDKLEDQLGDVTGLFRECETFCPELRQFPCMRSFFEAVHGKEASVEIAAEPTSLATIGEEHSHSERVSSSSTKAEETSKATNVGGGSTSSAHASSFTHDLVDHAGGGCDNREGNDDCDQGQAKRCSILRPIPRQAAQHAGVWSRLVEARGVASNLAKVEQRRFDGQDARSVASNEAEVEQRRFGDEVCAAAAAIVEDNNRRRVSQEARLKISSFLEAAFALDTGDGERRRQRRPDEHRHPTQSLPVQTARRRVANAGTEDMTEQRVNHVENRDVDENSEEAHGALGRWWRHMNRFKNSITFDIDDHAASEEEDIDMEFSQDTWSTNSFWWPPASRITALSQRAPKASSRTKYQEQELRTTLLPRSQGLLPRPLITSPVGTPLSARRRQMSAMPTSAVSTAKQTLSAEPGQARPRSRQAR
eukprot:TRINITY_DN18016_c0_g1_i2.p1 TRINITY_DN18016_c0_g1~~TRINITY_DN18016_c0_g1_i2.p1  ORF type:complete len:1075 (-),score=217.01 TRINITY_DN18016_c0_g1_i2:82-3306(-)